MIRVLPRTCPCPSSLLSFRSVRRGISTASKITKPSQLPKLIITPGSIHHNSLPTFLEYANRVNLAPEKTVYVGTHYEYTVAISLLRLGFSLIRTGRRADAGIDLIGHWILPPLPEPVPVIVQCKARSCGLSPQHVRELEGAFQGIPAEWRRRHVLGLLVTTHKATRGVLSALGMNRWPMAFVKVTRTGVVEQFLWNRSASEKGLEGVGVTLRHTPKNLIVEEACECKDHGASPKDSSQLKETGIRKDIQLTWMGQPIFPDRSELDDETLKLGEEIVSEEEHLVLAEHVTDEEVAKRRTAKARKRSGKLSSAKTVSSSETAKQGRGRATAAKSGMLVVSAKTTSLPVRKRGRPKGSRNKAKTIRAVQVSSAEVR